MVLGGGQSTPFCAQRSSKNLRVSGDKKAQERNDTIPKSNPRFRKETVLAKKVEEKNVMEATWFILLETNVLKTSQGRFLPLVS